MKTHKNKTGRKTRQLERENHIAELKAQISSLKKAKKKVDARVVKQSEYIQKIHNLIGTKKLKQYKKSSQFHGSGKQ